MTRAFRRCVAFALLVLAVGCAERPRRAPAANAPEVTNAEIEKADRTIHQLTDLVRTLPKSDAKVQRTIQLAEYYWLKSSLLHLRATSRFIKSYDQWFEANAGTPEPTLDDSESAAEKKKSAALYQLVIDSYPESPRCETAYFYLGQDALAFNLPKNATAAFTALSERF